MGSCVRCNILPRHARDPLQIGNRFLLLHHARDLLERIPVQGKARIEREAAAMSGTCGGYHTRHVRAVAILGVLGGYCDASTG